MKPQQNKSLQDPPDRSPHRRLLAALRARTLVPALIDFLSMGRATARQDDPRILRDWVESLLDDPGWEVLRSHVDDNPKSSAHISNDWQPLWSQAVAAGWSPRSDHHHALLFARFCDEMAASQDFDAATRFWNQSIDAWLRVLDSDYLGAWLENMGATDLKTRRHLLEPIIATRVSQLRRGLGLENASNATTIDLVKTRFSWQSLAYLDERIEASNSADPSIVGLGEAVKREQTDIRSAILGQFGRMVDALDLSAPNIDTVLAPFLWVDAIFEILPIDASVAARVADAAVDIGWKLRKQSPDDLDKSMKKLLNAARPFNEALEAFILEGAAFGHNSTCADFLVFRGEHRARSKGRDEYFERAIAVCPGHRNASMMLSYEKLRKLSDLLLRMRLVPSAITMLPGTPKHLESAVSDAWKVLDEAEALYPSNETITEYRQQLAHEADRLGMEKTQ